MYMLRTLELGLTLNELEQYDIGFIYDMLIEKQNDGETYTEIANQADFDSF